MIITIKAEGTSIPDLKKNKFYSSDEDKGIIIWLVNYLQ